MLRYRRKLPGLQRLPWSITRLAPLLSIPGCPGLSGDLLAEQMALPENGSKREGHHALHRAISATCTMPGIGWGALVKDPLTGRAKYMDTLRPLVNWEIAGKRF